ncbi:hypothetical protein G7K_2326-t1 [Saitoella complicata NRRL Y-17804]|uniref:Uncharacterized protein n=1 Tax=Saitoella complicata (strain BCRC 22490 / CBS 7301 / JCM 7358 / NBRC 10748 / NRRL Y-17804) TaxID=698492 RepID=A0A0E9NE70_SAICN|nr:hypothetical protein G7K_2326-t1 [Saitoella complicata NRRL Y-17804]
MGLDTKDSIGRPNHETFALFLALFFERRTKTQKGRNRYPFHECVSQHAEDEGKEAEFVLVSIPCYLCPSAFVRMSGESLGQMCCAFRIRIRKLHVERHIPSLESRYFQRASTIRKD